MAVLLIWYVFAFQGLPGSAFRGEKGEPGAPGPQVSINNVITVIALHP